MESSIYIVYAFQNFKNPLPDFFNNRRSHSLSRAALDVKAAEKTFSSAFDVFDRFISQPVGIEIRPYACDAQRISPDDGRDFKGVNFVRLVETIPRPR